MKKVALILYTGLRVDFIDQSIKCSTKLINEIIPNNQIDIFVISFSDISIVSDYQITNLTYDRPDDNLVSRFPKSRQQLESWWKDNKEVESRVSFGYSILYGCVPNTIHQHKDLFDSYDYILKSRCDLIFDFDKVDLKRYNGDKQLLTFECFWGGCRYNSDYTNDHIVFGKSEDVLKICQFPITDCILDRFWNGESYTTWLFRKTNKERVELTSDKYFLLSLDRKSRKMIGSPIMEKICDSDIEFLKGLGVDLNRIEFTDRYDF